MKTADAFDPTETLEWMRETFVVHPESGQLVWRNPPKQRRHLTGTQAGTARPTRYGKSYVHIKRNRRAIKRGWLIFLWLNGRWPEPELDHEDGNSLNDAKDNIREATRTQNAWNHKRRAKSSPLPMGVRSLRSGQFQARIGVNRKQIALGSFTTVDAARAAYLAKRKEMFGEFA